MQFWHLMSISSLQINSCINQKVLCLFLIWNLESRQLFSFPVIHWGQLCHFSHCIYTITHHVSSHEGKERIKVKMKNVMKQNPVLIDSQRQEKRLMEQRVVSPRNECQWLFFSIGCCCCVTVKERGLNFCI